MSIRTFLLIICIIPLRIEAQSSGGSILEVQQLNPINISYDNIDALMQDVRVDNAFQVTVQPQKTRCQLYAQLVFNDPATPAPPASCLLLKLRTVNHMSVNTAEVPLSLTPARVSDIEPSQNPTILNYDVVVKSQQSMSNIGLHNFTINFTIVQP
jgi:hypothetical protein